MPTYEVTDPKSGRVLELTGEKPPTEQDLDALFAQYKDAPGPKEGIVEGFVKPTLKAIPRVVTHTAASMAQMPVSGMAALGKLISSGGDLTAANKVLEDNQQVLNDAYLTTDAERKGAENIGLAMKPFEMAGQGLEEIVKQTPLKGTIAEPIANTVGQAAAMFGTGKAGEAVKLRVGKNLGGLENIDLSGRGKPYSIRPNKIDGSIIKEPIQPVPEPPNPIKETTNAPEQTMQAENTVKPAANVEPLIEEAKKYKSAEEFVKAQGIEAWHGSKRKIEGDLSLKYAGEQGGDITKNGFTFSTKDVAEQYKQGLSHDELVKMWGEAETKKIEDRTTMLHGRINMKNPLTVDASGYDYKSKYYTDPKDGLRSRAFMEYIKQMEDGGHDGIIFKNVKDTFGGKEDSTVYFIKDAKQFKTVEQLTSIWNKAQEGKGTPKVEIPVENKPINVEQVTPSEIPSPKQFENQSRVFDRLQKEHPEALEGNLEYTKINLENEAQKATELITNDKQKAYRLAMNMEETAEVTNTAVNIAMSEKALQDGNLTLYSKLVKNRSLAQTRRGQEIVSEKGSVSDNDTSRFVKELIATRLEKLGSNFFDDLKGRVSKKASSNKSRGIDKIDREVQRAQERTSNKMIDIKEAQSLIDKLMCR